MSDLTGAFHTFTSDDPDDRESEFNRGASAQWVGTARDRDACSAFAAHGSRRP